MSIQAEKIAQAKSLVRESGVAAWITFGRETALGGDPVLPLLIEGGLTWHSALIIGASGKAVAVVGNYDADPLMASGNWDAVIPYVQDIRPALLEGLALAAGGLGRLAVNYCESDPKADGITHGMYRTLERLLEGTEWEGSLTSAADIVIPVRSRKTASEIAAMQSAVDDTTRMFTLIEGWAKVGVSEREVYDRVHAEARSRGLGFSWDPAGDPIVNSGPDSMIGHGIPSASITIQPGHIFHVDLGLVKNGYSSDIQRIWYVGDEVPDDVEKGFEAVYGAISAGAELLKPGALGRDVDAAARKFIQDAGYPEYMHALGHQVGLVAHDGGALLGPEWARYGNTPRMPVEVGHVYTLELGVTLPGRGYLGLEEMVLVTEDGLHWLAPRQSSVMLLRP